jgi:hypothetical protein
MGEPITESSDELLSFRSHHPFTDVPTRLVVDVSKGKITANAFATYVFCRVRLDRGLRTSLPNLAKLRRVTLEQIEKHLDQLVKHGWVRRDGGIIINDEAFQTERAQDPLEILEQRYAARMEAEA